MFNDNSTSVSAWRALLGHAQNQRIPFIRESGTSWEATLSAATHYAYSRLSVAGDTKAGLTGSSGDFPEVSEFAGYRTVDPRFLDAVAKDVVRQVRLLGPFLSLAEFVNRQLSGGFPPVRCEEGAEQRHKPRIRGEYGADRAFLQICDRDRRRSGVLNLLNYCCAG